MLASRDSYIQKSFGDAIINSLSLSFIIIIIIIIICSRSEWHMWIMDSNK